MNCLDRYVIFLNKIGDILKRSSIIFPPKTAGLFKARWCLGGYSLNVWSKPCMGCLLSQSWPIMIFSCRIFHSFGNPAVTNRAYALPTPLLFWNHLVSPAEIRISARHFVTDLGSGQTGSAVQLMSISKHHLVPKYICIFFYTSVRESQALVWS